MLLYIGFPTKFLTSIQQRVLDLIDSGRYFELKDLQNSPMDFIKLIPELEFFLIEHRFKIENLKEIFLMKVDPKSITSVHSDTNSTSKRCLALNIPIKVDPTSQMIWYHQGLVESYRDHPYYGKYAVFQQPGVDDQLDSLSLTYPHLCRVDILHNISNPVPTERFILSIRFDPDPTDHWTENFLPVDISKLKINDTFKLAY